MIVESSSVVDRSATLLRYLLPDERCHPGCEVTSDGLREEVLGVGDSSDETDTAARPEVFRTFIEHCSDGGVGIGPGRQSYRRRPSRPNSSYQAAKWHVPHPKPINDAYIAATAFTRRMTLVTRNVKDFETLGIALKNPWSAPPA
ncbi:hypothetical protein FHT78_005920 [Rhizobium sp. BK196]|nr:hypothetical protein [Rhizobium sp. BK196]MBB3314113.1 hypothetical protein [Rhizobium sp. BK196]